MALYGLLITNWDRPALANPMCTCTVHARKKVNVLLVDMGVLLNCTDMYTNGHTLEG